MISRSYVKFNFKHNLFYTVFAKNLFFSFEKRTFTDYFLAKFFEKRDFQQEFHRAQLSFSLNLRSANWWEPGSGTIWKLRMHEFEYGHQ